MIKVLGVCVRNLRWGVKAAYVSKGLLLDIIVIFIRALRVEYLREAHYAVVATQAGRRCSAYFGFHETSAQRAIGKGIGV